MDEGRLPPVCGSRGRPSSIAGASCRGWCRNRDSLSDSAASTEGVSTPWIQSGRLSYRGTCGKRDPLASDVPPSQLWPTGRSGTENEGILELDVSLNQRQLEARGTFHGRTRSSEGPRSIPPFLVDSVHLASRIFLGIKTPIEAICRVLTD